jgi:hypothetical protein
MSAFAPLVEAKRTSIRDCRTVVIYEYTPLGKKQVECPPLPALERNRPGAQQRVATLDKHTKQLLADIETCNKNHDEHMPQRRGKDELAAPDSSDLS